MQPGAGTTVERQVAGEFGDRSPVLKPNQTKKNDNPKMYSKGSSDRNRAPESVGLDF